MAAEFETSIVDSGTYTPESQKMRRRLAESMMKAGMDTSPIQSPWQGLARIAQAMLGGYQAHKLGEEEKGGQKALADATAGKYGLAPSLSTAPGAPQPPSPMSGDKAKLGKQIAEYFVKQGMTPTQAAAVAGNMVWEGGGRTDLVNPGDNWRNSPRSPHSVGIAQWNDRAPKLIEFARSQGIDIPGGNMLDSRYMQDVIRRIPLETQLGFAWQEMQGPEGRALAMIKAAPDDLDASMKGAISYHRPAGWTWNNPSGGHAYGQRSGLAKSILDELRKAAPAQVAQAGIPGVATDAPQVGVTPINMPPMAPTPAGAPPAPAPAPGVPAPAAAPPGPTAQMTPAPAQMSMEQMKQQAWQSLGPRGALVQQMLRSSDPRIRAAGEAEISGALSRIVATQPPIEPKKQADLAYTQSQIAENQAQLPKHQADARKANAEARKVELESEKLITREEGYARGRDAINKALGLPERYGKFAYDRATGPVAGAGAAGQEMPTWHGDPINYLKRTGVELGGQISHRMFGGASPEDVQSAIGGLQSELGQFIRKANGMSAKEGDSNVELQNFLKMVGRLPTATAEELPRRLYDVNLRFARLMGQEPKDLEAFSYPADQRAEPGTHPADAIKAAPGAILNSLPNDPITGKSWAEAFPDAAQPPTIVNKQTGERMILRDGKWQPL